LANYFNLIKHKTLNCLSTVADDAKEKEPDKKLIAGNLKKVTETLAEASKSTEEAKNFGIMSNQF
jgi:hypothetical protein